MLNFSGLQFDFSLAANFNLIIENEYDDENPIETMPFNDFDSLQKWFYDYYKYNEALIVLGEYKCGKDYCHYILPQLTLHHGVYLKSFKINISDGKKAIESFTSFQG